MKREEIMIDNCFKTGYRGGFWQNQERQCHAEKCYKVSVNSSDKLLTENTREMKKAVL